MAGFYSIVLPVAQQIPRNLIGTHRKIAVRVTRHKLVKQLTSSLNMPLVSTSANKSGHRSVKTHRECIRQFGKRVMVLSGTTNLQKDHLQLSIGKAKRFFVNHPYIIA